MMTCRRACCLGLRWVLLLAAAGLVACGASQATEAGPAQPGTELAPDDPLLRFHARARALAAELGELGFPIKISEVTLTLRGNAPRLRAAEADEYAEYDNPGESAFQTVLRALGGKGRAGGGGGVLAYYDIGGQYVVFNEARLDRSADVDLVVAHELVHVYQDQSQGGSEAFDMIDWSTFDRRLVAQAIGEGEAMLVARGLIFKRLGFDLAELDPVIGNDGLDRLLTGSGVGFLYVQGENFLAAQYQRGGWAAVRKAYQEPPASSEQLVHPDKYKADTPQVVTLPDWPNPTDRVKKLSVEVAGEVGLSGLLAQALHSEDDLFGKADDAADLATIGWDGDRLDVYELPNGSRAALLRSVWDVEEAADAFTKLVERALEQNDAPREKLSLKRRGTVVDLAFSDDKARLPELARALEQHPRNFHASAEDAKSTRAELKACAARIAAKPRIENGAWVHPLSGVRVAIPEDWKPKILNGARVIAGAPGRGYLAAQQTQDLYEGDVAAFVQGSVQQIRQSSIYGDVEGEVRAIAGTKVGVITLRIGRSKALARLRLWAIPRPGHYFLLAVRLRAGDWESQHGLLKGLERGLQIEATPAGSAPAGG